MREHKYTNYHSLAMPWLTAETLRMIIRKPIFKIFLIGLIIRLILMPLFSYPYDEGFWVLTIQHIQADAGLYEISGYWYTPVWGYVLGTWSNVMDLFGVTAYEQLIPRLLPSEHAFESAAALVTIPFNFLVKIPLLISDIVAGYIIYKILIDRTGSEKKATYGFALWFLCPLVIFLSAVQGMFDTIAALFIALSVYSLFKGRDILTGVSLSVAILTKVFPVLLIFTFIAYLAMKHRGDKKVLLRRIVTIAAALCLTSIIIYLPQLIDGTVMESLRFLTTRVDGISTEGYYSDTTRIAYILPIIGVVLAPVFAAIMYFKGRMNKEEAFISCSMISLAFVLIIPTSSQFYLMLIPFIIIFIVMFDKRLILPFMVISVAALLYSITTLKLDLLLSLAAYTNILDFDNVVSIIEWMKSETWGSIIDFFKNMIMVGVILLFIYWVRYKREVPKDD